MISKIEIDERYKELMAQKEQSVSADDILQTIAWITNDVAPDVYQQELRKISEILITQLQRFQNWEKVQKENTFCEELANAINKTATTQYVDGESKNSYTECLVFLFRLSGKLDEREASEIVQQYWSFQDILPTIKGIFLLEKEDGTKYYPVYEMVIGMAHTFECDNDHLLNLAIALQLFDRMKEYVQIQETEQVQREILEIARQHKIEFLTFIMDGGSLSLNEMDYKTNGTLIAYKGKQIIIRNIRKEYFRGYFPDEEIFSENQLAWYVIVNLTEEEETTDLKEILQNEPQENKLDLLKKIEKEGIFNVFMPKRIIWNRRNHKIIRFLNPASVNDERIIYDQKTEENEKEGFLKLLHGDTSKLRGCWLFHNKYDCLTVDFFATFYLEMVKGRWDFCIDLEDGNENFYQEKMICKYLQESLQDADQEKAYAILEDLYSFMSQYFDFDSINENTLMDGKLLAFPLIRGIQTILKEYFSREKVMKRIFGDAMEEWKYAVAEYKTRSWNVNGKRVAESDFYNIDFERMKENGEVIPRKNLHVFFNENTGEVMINTDFENAERKIEKLCEFEEKQIITYEKKDLYMNENLTKLLTLMDANDINHLSKDFFQCEDSMRKSVYLYKILWHFQVFEMGKERIEKFWRLIINKHYRGMIEDKQTISEYFEEMQGFVEEDNTLLIAKESSGNDSTLQYLYEHVVHQHGARNYLSWAFDEGKINRNLSEMDGKILWRGKQLKKIIFMVDNLMKGSSLRKMLDFHLSETVDANGDKKISGKKRDYLAISPTVRQMLDKIENLQIEVHPIFGFQSSVENIEREYPVKIIIHKKIPERFYSDEETVDLVQELYDEGAEKGVCCVFRCNNLPAKSVLPSYVCNYQRRVGLFMRSREL